MPGKVGLCYHNRLPAAQDLAAELAQVLKGKGMAQATWLCAAWDDVTMQANIPSSDLLVSIGGDGTMLWAARGALTLGIPVLGVRMGSMTFLAQIAAGRALELVPSLLQREACIDERSTIQAEVPSAGANGERYYAVNDAVVARGTVGRPITLHVDIDGDAVSSLRADAIIVATAIGSTAYSLSVGGPVLHPDAQDLVLNFVAPHMAHARALVVPGSAVVTVRVETDHQAVLSIDGQVNRPLKDGEDVRISRSPYSARFVRVYPSAETYSRLGRELGWLDETTS